MDITPDKNADRVRIRVHSRKNPIPYVRRGPIRSTWIERSQYESLKKQGYEIELLEDPKATEVEAPVEPQEPVVEAPVVEVKEPVVEAPKEHEAGPVGLALMEDPEEEEEVLDEGSDADTEGDDSATGDGATEEEDAAPEEEEEVYVTFTEEKLKEYTVAQLKGILDENQIEYSKSALKADLIAIILEAQEIDEEEETEE